MAQGVAAFFGIGEPAGIRRCADRNRASIRATPSQPAGTTPLTDPVHPAPADAEGDNPAPLVDRPAAAAAVEAETGDLAMELFHRVNRVLPEDQALVSVEPETSAREAIAIMTQRGFSQPVSYTHLTLPTIYSV